MLWLAVECYSPAEQWLGEFLIRMDEENLARMGDRMDFLSYAKRMYPPEGIQSIKFPQPLAWALSSSQGGEVGELDEIEWAAIQATPSTQETSSDYLAEGITLYDLDDSNDEWVFSYIDYAQRGSLCVCELSQASNGALFWTWKAVDPSTAAEEITTLSVHNDRLLELLNMVQWPYTEHRWIERQQTYQP